LTNPQTRSVETNRVHGLSGRFKLLPGEDPAEFQESVRFLFRTFRPATLDACLAALHAAIASWLIRRADRIEETLRARQGEPLDHPTRMRLERPRAVQRRALCRALAALGHKFDENATTSAAPGDLFRQAVRHKRGRPIR
jgi:hypothetical protein